MASPSDRARTLEAVRHRGWRVVRLGHRVKYPITEHWETTPDVDQVAAWLDAGYNIGLVCHEQTGVAVLDPDKIEWADMIDTLGQPSLPWVLTGSGKLHFYVAWAPNLPAKLRWHGAIIGEIQRGPGQQQVVLPPSIHPDTGLPYRWITVALMPQILCAPIDPVSDPLPRLPEPWLEFLRRDHAVQRDRPALDVTTVADRHAHALHQPGARLRAGGTEVKFQCPGCAALGRDRAQDNARLFHTGAWGCAVYATGTRDSLTHWRAIGITLGVLGLDGRPRARA